MPKGNSTWIIKVVFVNKGISFVNRKLVNVISIMVKQLKPFVPGIGDSNVRSHWADINVPWIAEHSCVQKKSSKNINDLKILSLKLGFLWIFFL